jgi:hypothetical protein
MFTAGAFGPLVAALVGARFDHLDSRVAMREVIPAAVLLKLGVQTISASSFLSILGLDDEAGALG